MSKKFQKRVEDFVCDNCNAKINGSGYTNHCPNCLWSKHVDINPGDRAAICNGLMPPLGLWLKRGDKFIIHRCLSCGHEKINMAQTNDNKGLIIKLSSLPWLLRNKNLLG